MVRQRFELKNTRYQSFDADKKYFVIQKTDNIIEQYFVDDFIKKTQLPIDFQVMNLTLLQGLIYFTKMYDGSLYKSNSPLEILNQGLKCSEVNKDAQIALVYKEENGGFFNLEVNKLIWCKKGLRGLKIIDAFTYVSNIYQNDNCFLCRVDPKTGDLIWRGNVAELGRYAELGTKEQKSGYVHKIIGVHEGIVWVSITNDTILGLSIATGEVLHLIRQTLPFDFEFLNESRIPNSTAVILNKTQNILQGFSQGFYWETDLATMQTQVWNLRAYFQSIPLDDFSFRIEAFGSNHMVFTCGLEYDAIGLFNTQTRQVDWWQHLGENGPRRGVNVMTLKVVGDRIYTIDTTNTLRIFERSNQ